MQKPHLSFKKMFTLQHPTLPFYRAPDVASGNYSKMTGNITTIIEVVSLSFIAESHISAGFEIEC